MLAGDFLGGARKKRVQMLAQIRLRIEYSVIGMDICIDYENNIFWIEITFETYTDKELEIGKSHDEFLFICT
jgi:hypothetical protein